MWLPLMLVQENYEPDFRILNLLLNGYSPEKFCVTYTNAAASEMYDRLLKNLVVGL